MPIYVPHENRQLWGRIMWTKLPTKRLLLHKNQLTAKLKHLFCLYLPWRRKFCNMSSVQMCVHKWNYSLATRASNFSLSQTVYKRICLTNHTETHYKYLKSSSHPVTYHKTSLKALEHFKRKPFHDIYKSWSITVPQSDMNDILRKQKWARIVWFYFKHIIHWTPGFGCPVIPQEKFKLSDLSFLRWTMKSFPLVGQFKEEGLCEVRWVRWVGLDCLPLLVDIVTTLQSYWLSNVHSV